MAKPNHILFGYPRSGTTWICEILASGGELTYLHEPDNERINISGLLAKKGQPRYTISGNADRVVALFGRSLAGQFLPHSDYLSKAPLHVLGYSVEFLESFIGNPNEVSRTKNRVKLSILSLLSQVYGLTGVSKQDGPFLLKSVHSGLMMETLLNALDFVPLISIRHPAAVLRSMKTLNNKDLYRGLELREELTQIIPKKYMADMRALKTPLEKQALQIGIHHYYWSTLMNKYSVTLIRHEDLLHNTEDAFRNLFQQLDLTWSERVSQTIKEKNESGQGYKTTRNAPDLVDVWKGAFNQDELDEIKRGYLLLPNTWYTDFNLS